MVHYHCRILTEIREFAATMSDSKVKSAALQVSDEVEALTQFIVEQSKTTPDFHKFCSSRLFTRSWATQLRLYVCAYQQSCSSKN